MQSDILSCACRPEESDYAALDEDNAGILADVLHGPVLTKARSGLECSLAVRDICSLCCSQLLLASVSKVVCLHT